MIKSRKEEYDDLGLEPFSFRWKLQRNFRHSNRSANWHNNIEIQYCNEGEGYVIIDGVRHNIYAGDIVVANSNALHFTATDSYLTYSVIIIDTKFCEEIGISPSENIFETKFRNEKIAKLFKEISKTYQKYADPCYLAKQKILILKLLVELRENHFLGLKENVYKGTSFESVKKVMNFIHSNYNRTFSLDELSTAMNVNKYNIIKNFRKYTGFTVMAYTNHYRCTQAKILILDGTPVHEAARLCGFNNMSFFTKTFKECIGALPSNYKVSKRI